MMEALKKLDKKFLITGGIIIAIPILLVIILAIIQGCSNRKMSYSKYESKMIDAAKKYINEENKVPKEESEVLTVDLNDLITSKYIKDPAKAINDETCSGKVYVRLNGSNVGENNGGFYNYTPNLLCKNYKSSTLKELLLKEVVTSGSGLYQADNKFVFKGDETKNYINFYDYLYVIIGMDENGLIKLLKIDSEPRNVYWDIKYNTEVSKTYGKNIYEDSYILKQLRMDYNDPNVISEDEKVHIVSKDTCIGVRDVTNISPNSNSECSKYLPQQNISLIGITDYANASLDPECNSIISLSCMNYNYLSDLRVNSWTAVAVSDNTYEAYYIGNGIISCTEARTRMSYNLVIYIDSNEIVKDGDGSINNPFVIK